MPPRNYKFEKRQKDLAKSKKKEEKLQKKLMKKASDDTSDEFGNTPEDSETNAPEQDDSVQDDSVQEDNSSNITDSAQAQPETNH